jgi:hypothetical protein
MDYYEDITKWESNFVASVTKSEKFIWKVQRGPKVTSLVARQAHATFASDSRMWHASGVNLAHVTQKLLAKLAYDVRHVARVSWKCCAHLPRATRDVTFGPLCMSVAKLLAPGRFIFPRNFQCTLNSNLVCILCYVCFVWIRRHLWQSK